jgi:hypothetical protein
MPTTPAELLAELHAATASAGPEGPDSARWAGAAAAGAVAALGGYPARLYRYSPPSDDADVITQGIHDRQIAELAIACRALGQVASGGPHRLIDLAGAFADAAAITSAHATRDQRWAFAVATVEEIDHLATLVAAGSPIGTGARERADRVRAAALPIQQRAARQPPTRAANALLDAPIPDAGNPWPPRTQNATVGVAIHAAMATLLAGTRPSAEPLTIAEVLAIAMAAHGLCRAVDDPSSHTRPGTAAEAWSGVRTALAPFNDGSRRRHHSAPRHIAAARRIYDLTNGRRFAQADTGIIDAIQRLPQLAEHLQITVQHWPWTSVILAHAYRLPAREERVEAILAGARPSGIIRADPTDLTPVLAVLGAARTLSVDLAVRLSRQGSTTAHHIVAAHQQWRSRPDSGDELAHARAMAARHAPPAQLMAQPRRGRAR